MKPGTLYLIPVPLGPSPLHEVLPDAVIAQAAKLTHFVAENAKSARAFLKSMPSITPLQQINIQELNEHTPPQVVARLLDPLRVGHDLGLISEAGCPAIADPGAVLVALAHDADIPVVPMVGPSSLLLALMGSGLCGQNFAFHGYLPAKEVPRHKRILELENESRRMGRTQLFIETPYRNAKLFDALLTTCAPSTRIGIAADLTLSSPYLMTRQCDAWRQSERPDIDKRPAVFLLQACSSRGDTV